MSDNLDALFLDAANLWSSFKTAIIYKNRYNSDSEILNHIDLLKEKNSRIINSNTVLFRARRFSDSETGNASQGYEAFLRKRALDAVKNFYGYNEKDSFVPDASKVKVGRANPQYISYLYVAESEYTALAEVKPYLKSQISIAEVKVLEDLNVFDFSLEQNHNVNDLTSAIGCFIGYIFSKPNDGDEKEYIPTQFIAEYIKNLGFEGIRYNSSLDFGGRNVIIFTPNKCKVVSSKLYQLEEIAYKAKCINPENQPSLNHPAFKLPMMNIWNKE